MRILITVDESAFNGNLFRSLQALVPFNNAEAYLLAVNDQEGNFFSTEDTPSKVELGTEKLNLIFHFITSRLEKYGATVTDYIFSGIPDVVVSKFAKDRGIDLTIVIPKEHTSTESLIKGSTAKRIASDTPGTVLFLRNGDKSNQLKNVVVAVDNTKSLYTLENIISQLSLDERGVNLTIVQVVPEIHPRLSKLVQKFDHKSEVSFDFEVVKEKAEKILHRRGIFKYKVIRLEGDPCEEILRVVDENKAQLVITGGLNKDQFKHFILGSVASNLITRAGCSVAVVNKRS